MNNYYIYSTSSTSSTTSYTMRWTPSYSWGWDEPNYKDNLEAARNCLRKTKPY